MLLLLALLVRLTYLPRLGNAYDLDAYRAWMGAIQRHGLDEVFARTDADYTGYLYLLWALGKGFGRDATDLTVRDKELRLWLKFPGLAGDLIVTVLVALLTRSLLRRARFTLAPGALRTAAGRLALADAEAAAVCAGALWALHPAAVYIGAYWGQNDSLVTAFALAAIWAALRGHPIAAAMLLGTGALLKPQPLIVAPVLAWVIVRRAGWGGLVRGAVAGAAVLALGHLYFIVTGHADVLLHILRTAVLTTDRLSYSAYNLWWLLAGTDSPPSTAAALRIGGTGIAWGALASLLVLVVLAVTLVGLARRADDAGILAACAYFIFGFFTVGAGIHERYDLAAVAFLAPVIALAPRWGWLLFGITVTLTINVLLGLPLDQLYRQGHPVWLSMATAATNVALLGWATWCLLWKQGRKKHDEAVMVTSHSPNRHGFPT